MRDLGRRLVELGSDHRRVTTAPVHGVVQLTHTWRFGGAIDALARAIRAADADAAIAVLRSGASDVEFSEKLILKPRRRRPRHKLWLA